MANPDTEKETVYPINLGCFTAGSDDGSSFWISATMTPTQCIAHCKQTRIGLIAPVFRPKSNKLAFKCICAESVPPSSVAIDFAACSVTCQSRSNSAADIGTREEFCGGLGSSLNSQVWSAYRYYYTNHSTSGSVNIVSLWSRAAGSGGSQINTPLVVGIAVGIVVLFGVLVFLRCYHYPRGRRLDKQVTSLNSLHLATIDTPLPPPPPFSFQLRPSYLDASNSGDAFIKYNGGSMPSREKFTVEAARIELPGSGLNELNNMKQQYNAIKIYPTRTTIAVDTVATNTTATATKKTSTLKRNPSKRDVGNSASEVVAGSKSEYTASGSGSGISSPNEKSIFSLPTIRSSFDSQSRSQSTCSDVSNDDESSASSSYYDSKNGGGRKTWKLRSITSSSKLSFVTTATAATTATTATTTTAPAFATAQIGHVGFLGYMGRRENSPSSLGGNKFYSNNLAKHFPHTKSSASKLHDVYSCDEKEGWGGSSSSNSVVSITNSSSVGPNRNLHATVSANSLLDKISPSSRFKSPSLSSYSSLYFRTSYPPPRAPPRSSSPSFVNIEISPPTRSSRAATPVGAMSTELQINLAGSFKQSQPQPPLSSSSLPEDGSDNNYTQSSAGLSMTNEQDNVSSNSNSRIRAVIIVPENLALYSADALGTAVSSTNTAISWQLAMQQQKQTKIDHGDATSSIFMEAFATNEVINAAPFLEDWEDD
ncbi:hypothetical protein HK100_010775 [Physocladia obscura]|uniref:WSC domain-containing protein n=1 Tax=Physocladia obscura TaxID=109957 RepID=A0AAD5XEK0_9FUNG|nr:hypothetical protein HK100_010775 [Physocladia obscura]